VEEAVGVCCLVTHGRYRRILDPQVALGGFVEPGKGDWLLPSLCDAILRRRRRARAASSRGPWDHPRLHRQQTLALHLFAGELAGATDGFRLLPDSLLGGFFVMAAELHLAEDALALHLLLQHLEGLVDIVVADENLHAVFLFDRAVNGPDGQGARATGARICTIRMPMTPAVRTNVDS